MGRMSTAFLVIGFLVSVNGADAKGGVGRGEELLRVREPVKDFAVVGYLPEWRFGGTDWCALQCIPFSLYKN
jgi:hypothetical protein